MKGFWKYVIGTILTLVIAFGARVLIAEWYIQRVTDNAQKSLARIQTNSQAQLQAIKDRQAAEKEQQKINADQELEVQRAAAEKERAWNAFYKEPKDCLNWQSDKHMVECVNHKMREKEKFEQMWVSGSITRA